MRNPAPKESNLPIWSYSLYTEEMGLKKLIPSSAHIFKNTAGLGPWSYQNTTLPLAVEYKTCGAIEYKK